MQLSDLVKDVRKMSDEQLMEHVRGIRHNKYVAKPAAAKKRAEPAKREAKRATGKLNNMVSKLSPAERKALLLQLNGG